MGKVKDDIEVRFERTLQVTIKVSHKEVLSSRRINARVVGHDPHTLVLRFKVNGFDIFDGLLNIADLDMMTGSARYLVKDLEKLGFTQQKAWQLLQASLEHHAPDEARAMLERVGVKA